MITNHPVPARTWASFINTLEYWREGKTPESIVKPREVPTKPGRGENSRKNDQVQVFQVLTFLGLLKSDGSLSRKFKEFMVCSDDFVSRTMFRSFLLESPYKAILNDESYRTMSVLDLGDRMCQVFPRLRGKSMKRGAAVFLRSALEYSGISVTHIQNRKSDAIPADNGTGSKESLLPTTLQSNDISSLLNNGIVFQTIDPKTKAPIVLTITDPIYKQKMMDFMLEKLSGV